jgi:hypothetical protein
MDDDSAGRKAGPRAAQYRILAAHWRQLAATATTAPARAHLIAKARMYDALANDTGLVARPVEGMPLKGSRR